MQSLNTHLEYIEVAPRLKAAPFCAVVAEGLSTPRKWLPCRFFYDRTGSELFERICDLPEYYLTRTERAILERSSAEIVAAAGREIAVVEFGSGSSIKTRLLLAAALHNQPRLHYLPIDISGDFLRSSALALLNDYEGLDITAIAAEYHDGIARLPHTGLPRLILFLGSSIGNFTREEATEFLTHVRASMRPNDRLLIGIDLLKERRHIEAAYNDSQGITAAFNKNLLTRVNRELGANIDTGAFMHAAPFVEEHSRIEMHLVCRRSHQAYVSAVDMTFQFHQGETIHTENSHKYSLSGFAALCQQAGLSVQRRWADEREWFALLLIGPEPFAVQG
jgi:L-histidine N-alpha-methyltransferase